MAPGRTEGDWLQAVRASVLRGDLTAAQESVARARVDHPHSIELCRTQAGIHQQAGRTAEAEALLRELLGQDPGDIGAAFALAKMLKEQGRMAAAAATMRAAFAVSENCRDPDLAINAIELLDNCDRKADAAAIAQSAIAQNPRDVRLHTYAGMLQIQLGEFEQARRHYLFALEHDVRAWEWHVPIGLVSAQRYPSAKHSDFALLWAGLQQQGLSEKARAELHFALGKAYDDVGDYGQAARHFREGNAMAHRATRWSRKAWRRAVEARLAAPAHAQHAEPTPGFTPVFIVGMPRSGTTLLAELLSRRRGIHNRGELPWIAKLAERPALTGNPGHAILQDAAASYAARARQDDAADARWFIDKQPLNFRYVDLMLALFPDARIIHCQRNARDNALSLWMQCFLEDVQGYAYNFDEIELVMQDCERLMAHWRQRFPDTIRSVRYEQLVSDADAATQGLADWIGLPPQGVEAPSTHAESSSSISTASLWQARQPVNSHSVGRWTRYGDIVPNLRAFPDR